MVYKDKADFSADRPPQEIDQTKSKGYGRIPVERHCGFFKEVLFSPQVPEEDFFPIELRSPPFPQVASGGFFECHYIMFDSCQQMVPIIEERIDELVRSVIGVGDDKDVLLGLRE